MAPYVIPDETLAYFLERGFRYYEKDAHLWRRIQKISRYGSTQDCDRYWEAKVINFQGPDHIVCTGPDPITCFVTAELMNWEKQDA